MNSLSPWIISIPGMIICAGGLVWVLMTAIPWMGRLPGDIYIDRPGVRFWFPLTSSIIVCVVIAVLWSLIRLVLLFLAYDVK